MENNYDRCGNVAKDIRKELCQECIHYIDIFGICKYDKDEE